MATVKNSKDWRKKKQAEGFKQRQYFLPEETIKAIETISTALCLTNKSQIIIMAIDKLIESDYKKEIDTKGTVLKRKVENTSKNLKTFMMAFLMSKHEQKDIDKMKTFLKKNQKETKTILTEKFFQKLKKAMPISFPSYEEYRIFVIAFVDEDQ